MYESRIKKLLPQHIVYDCEKVPNEFRCLICNESIKITSPARLSTLLYLQNYFSKKHRHLGEKNEI